VTVDRLPAGEVRVGPAYEADRLSDRARLSAVADERRVGLGADLVLVFETPETVRMALEELLRTERVDDGERVADETTAFAALLGDEHDVAATLYVDVADPVALAERLTELAGAERAVSLEVGGRRVVARSDPGDSGSGAFHLLFALDDQQRAALRAGLPVSIRVEHTACRATATLGAGQALAIGTELDR
jgi:Protein of unknown function (DUF3501)